MIPESKWIWRGLGGHYCLSHSCRFRLHTVIGKYKISTVGAMYFEGSKNMETIGVDRHYETMVFEEGKGYSEIDFAGIEKGKKEDPYESDKRAEEMHMSMCYKYAVMQEDK